MEHYERLDGSANVLLAMFKTQTNVSRKYITVNPPQSQKTCYYLAYCTLRTSLT